MNYIVCQHEKSVTDTDLREARNESFSQVPGFSEKYYSIKININWRKKVLNSVFAYRFYIFCTNHYTSLNWTSGSTLVRIIVLVQHVTLLNCGANKEINSNEESYAFLLRDVASLAAAPNNPVMKKTQTLALQVQWSSFWNVRDGKNSSWFVNQVLEESCLRCQACKSIGVRTLSSC